MFEKIDAAAKNLFPGYFAVVMSTGATSIAAHLLELERIARLLLASNLVIYAVLVTLTGIRIIRHPRRLVNDMQEHATGPGFFTIVAATCILATQIYLVTGLDGPSRILGMVGILLWVIIMYWFFVAITVRRHKPSLGKGINGAWLLATVATQSLAVLTVVVPWQAETMPLTMFLALCFFLLGCMLYLAIIPLIFYRLTFVPMDMEDLTPPYWINMGAMAIATLAGSLLLTGIREEAALSQVIPFVKGFTLFMWASATWWIPLLVVLTLWRHAVARHPLRYDPQFWGMVFPLAMYTTATIRLSDALGLPFLMVIPKVSFWIALSAWFVTLAAMLVSFRRFP